MTHSNQFEAIHGEQFVVLTTYRRNGEPVPTTVWFAAYDGKLYVTTNRNLGKYKRILANAAVTVAASDRAGNIQGPPIPGRARALDEAEYELARSTLLDKYGETYRSMTEQMDARLPPGSRTYIESNLPENHFRAQLDAQRRYSALNARCHPEPPTRLAT